MWPHVCTSLSLSLQDGCQRECELLNPTAVWVRTETWVILLQILRVGAFEIIHSDMAPHATNEHVTLCRTCGHSSAASLANAVLRTLLRKRDAGALDAILPQAPVAPVATFDILPRKCDLLHSTPCFLVLGC